MFGGNGIMNGMTERASCSRIGSFAALGDSFTEGLNDPYPGGGFRGWADRVAQAMAKQTPGFRYANLAVRGKILGEIIAEQVPRAVQMVPDLVSLAGGGNDILRGTGGDVLAPRFEQAVADLQGAGCRVLIFTGFDMRLFPVIRLLRGRIAAYDMNLRGIADDHGCDLVDLWSMRALRDPRAWSVDRLHLSPEGHLRVALRTCEVLGVPVPGDWTSAGRAFADGPFGDGSAGDGAARHPVLGGGLSGYAAEGDGAGSDGSARRWRASRPAPWHPDRAARAVWLAARRQDAHWARQYALPWVRRRIARADASDSPDPKRPDLLPVDPGGLTG
jgi:lysophospholipase L1-like esterase